MDCRAFTISIIFTSIGVVTPIEAVNTESLTKRKNLLSMNTPFDETRTERKNLYRFPAELHIVHYNQKYADLATASGFSDGIAVLAILIEVRKHSFRPFEQIQMS